MKASELFAFIIYSMWKYVLYMHAFETFHVC